MTAVARRGVWRHRRMSPPEQNDGPAPLSSTQPTSGSAARASSAACRPGYIAGARALRRSGRLMVSVPTPSAPTSASTRLVPVWIVRPDVGDVAASISAPSRLSTCLAASLPGPPLYPLRGPRTCTHHPAGLQCTIVDRLRLAWARLRRDEHNLGVALAGTIAGRARSHRRCSTSWPAWHWVACTLQHRRRACRAEHACGLSSSSQH